MRNKITTAIGILLFTGCSSAPTGRQFLDSTTHSDSPPSWVKDTKISWDKGGVIYSKNTHSIRGDERVNGCYDLAKLDGKENLLSEIANDVKGRLDNAQQSISENAEVLLGKVRKGEFEGKIIGLKFSEQYFERYSIGDKERIDCHVLGEIKQSDYDKIKRSVVDKVAEIDPRIKEAITKGQVEFFQKDEPKSKEQ